MAHDYTCFIHFWWYYRKKDGYSFGIGNDCIHTHRYCIKRNRARPRPFIPDTEVILAADSQYAYPSGHSMIVAAGLLKKSEPQKLTFPEPVNLPIPDLTKLPFPGYP